MSWFPAGLNGLGVSRAEAVRVGDQTTSTDRRKTAQQAARVLLIDLVKLDGLASDQPVDDDLRFGPLVAKPLEQPAGTRGRRNDDGDFGDP